MSSSSPKSNLSAQRRIELLKIATLAFLSQQRITPSFVRGATGFFLSILIGAVLYAVDDFLTNRQLLMITLLPFVAFGFGLISTRENSFEPALYARLAVAPVSAVPEYEWMQRAYGSDFYGACLVWLKAEMGADTRSPSARLYVELGRFRNRRVADEHGPHRYLMSWGAVQRRND